MARIKRTISCVVCGKKRETTYSGVVKYCAGACRQSEYRSAVTEQVTELRNSVTQYENLLREIASEMNKDEKWIARKLELHAIHLIEDSHHGYDENTGIENLVDWAKSMKKK